MMKFITLTCPYCAGQINLFEDHKASMNSSASLILLLSFMSITFRYSDVLIRAGISDTVSIEGNGTFQG